MYKVIDRTIFLKKMVFIILIFVYGIVAGIGVLAKPERFDQTDETIFCKEIVRSTCVDSTEVSPIALPGTESELNTSGEDQRVGFNTDLSVSTESLDDTLAVMIPEKSWPDSHRVRSELTLDIAKKYPRGNFIPRRVDNNVWGVGEHLTFSIDYGFINAGTATMSVVGREEVNGGVCYTIESKTNSNKFISSFYKVRDKVMSYIDVDGIFSRRLEKNLREGGYVADRYVDFYHDRLIALNTREKYGLTEIPPYIQDILSSLYLIRTFDLKVGKDETIVTYADGKVYPLKVIVHKIENVKVPAGKFECFKVEPVLKSEGVFRQKGKLTVWLTNDEHKMPVKMTSKIVIGRIGSNLKKYSLGKIE